MSITIPVFIRRKHLILSWIGLGLSVILLIACNRFDIYQTEADSHPSGTEATQEEQYSVYNAAIQDLFGSTTIKQYVIQEETGKAREIWNVHEMLMAWIS